MHIFFPSNLTTLNLFLVILIGLILHWFLNFCFFYSSFVLHCSCFFLFFLFCLFANPICIVIFEIVKLVGILHIHTHLISYSLFLFYVIFFFTWNNSIRLVLLFIFITNFITLNNKFSFLIFIFHFFSLRFFSFFFWFIYRVPMYINLILWFNFKIV